MLFSSLEILFRHKWRYLIMLVVLPLIGAAVCIPLFPKSTATESVWVSDQTYLNTTSPSYQAYLTPSEIALSDMTQYFQTTAFADAVVQKLNRQNAFQSATEATDTRNSMGKNLSGSTGGANLVSLQYFCPRATLCPQVLVASVQVFETYETAVQTQQAKTASQIYAKQLQQAQQSLHTSQQALNVYLAAHPGENTGQTSSDPALATLVQNVSNAQTGVTDAQTKVSGVVSASQAAQQASATLYQIIDPARTSSSRLSSLPTKQMMIVFAAFWALTLIALLLATRLTRVVRHPAQVGRALGIPLAAVMAPIAAGPGPVVTHHLPAGELQ